MLGLIFTFALTFGGAFVALFRPFYGLLIYICFAIIKPEYLWPWSVPSGNYSRIIAFAMLVGWVLKGCGNWKLGRAGPVVTTLVCYLIWTLIAINIGYDTNIAFAYFEALLKIVLPFLVGITTIESLGQLRQIAWLIALCEGYLAYDFNNSYFSGFNRLWYEGFGGMDNNCNGIALVSCAGLVFFLGFNVQSWWRKGLVSVVWVFMVHAILFSFSRGAMLSLGITMILSIILLPKRPIYYLYFMLAAALVLQLAGPSVMERFGTTFAEEGTRDYSAASRLELWAACWDLMKYHPLGVGPGHFPLMVVQYGFPIGKEAHSLWLQLGAELGFPGLLLLAAFYGTTIALLWPLTRERTPVADPWFRTLARMVVAALVGFCVSAQFVSLHKLEHPYYIALLGAGTLKLASRRESTITLREATQQAVSHAGQLPFGSKHSPLVCQQFDPSHFMGSVAYTAASPETCLTKIPVLCVGVELPVSSFFVIKQRHLVLGEYEVPHSTAHSTVRNIEGEAELRDGMILGKKPGRIILKAVLTLADGRTYDTAELLICVQHLVAEEIWIEYRG